MESMSRSVVARSAASARSSDDVRIGCFLLMRFKISLVLSLIASASALRPRSTTIMDASTIYVSSKTLPCMKMSKTSFTSSIYCSGSVSKAILARMTSSVASRNAEKTPAFFFKIALASFIFSMSASFPLLARSRLATTWLIPISNLKALSIDFLFAAKSSSLRENSEFIISLQSPCFSIF